LGRAPKLTTVQREKLALEHYRSLIDKAYYVDHLKDTV
jgi:hypothetical protein